MNQGCSRRFLGTASSFANQAGAAWPSPSSRPKGMGSACLPLVEANICS